MTENRAIQALASLLLNKRMRLVTAESCTGGLLAARLTELAGSSDWFEGSFVTYRLSAKEAFLGVRHDTLERWGAVSEPTAREMAEGALQRSQADISVAITGVAGPGGGEPHTPTGTVWFAWATRVSGFVHAACCEFAGGREEVRGQAVEEAVKGLLAVLEDDYQRGS